MSKNSFKVKKSLVLTPGTEPASPQAGELYYDETEMKLMQYDENASSFIEVGSGSGSGGINYILNSDFESGISDVLATNDITLSIESTDPLRGTQSLKAVISQLQTGDDGVEFLMENFDEADLGKSVYISFDYKTAGSYTTDMLDVVMYNHTQAQFESVVGGNGAGKLVAADNGRFTGVFHLNNTDDNYSMFLRVLSAPSGSDAEIVVDNVILGPTTLIDAPIVTYMGQYTPTVTTTSGTMTNYTINADYWRIGDTVRVVGGLSFTGAPGTFSGVYVSQPPGLTVDTSKLPSVHFGAANFSDAGTGWSAGQSQLNGSNIWLTAIDSSGTTVKATNVTQIVPFAWVSGDSFEFEIEYPVEEWANSSAVLSTKEMMNKTGVVTVRRGTSAQTLSNATVTKIQLNDPIIDELGEFDSTTNYRYTANKAKRVFIHGKIYWTSSATNQRVLYIYKNGVEVSRNQHSPGSGTYIQESALVLDLQKGDYIELFGFQDTGGNLDVQYGATSFHTGLQIFEIPDLTVYATYPEPLKTQTKYLTADKTTDQTLTDLTFSNLVIGKSYQVDYQFAVSRSATALDNVNMVVTHNSSTISIIQIPAYWNSEFWILGNTVRFKATATTLTFSIASVGANTTVHGASSETETKATLSEIHPMQETTEFTP